MSGLMYRAAADTYGLGYFIEETSEGTNIVSHGGENEGWISHFYLIPE